MSHHDDQRSPASDDTFDDLFPARADRPGQASYEGRAVGSPPPPRGARMVLPWVIIGASALAIAVVGFMILRGQRTQPRTAAPAPVVTRTVTGTSPSTGRTTTPAGPTTSTPPAGAPTPAAATVPPPGFEKCAGTDNGYKVRGSGTTCAFVSDVARRATAQAATAQQGAFSFDATSAATGRTYTLNCVVGPYIQCTIPPTGSKTTQTFIYMTRN